MPVIYVNALGQYGLVKDENAPSLPLNALTDALNVRTTNGGIETIQPGFAVVSSLSVVPEFFHPFTLDLSLYGNVGSVYALQAGTSRDITRLSGPYNSSEWSFAPMQNFLAMTNGQDIPQVWEPLLGSAPLVDMPNWPAGYKAKIMTGFKNHIIAGNISSGLLSAPTMVKWSHPVDPGSSPVSWDPADPTKDAGEYSLSEDGSEIKDIVTLGDVCIVYKGESAYMMDYIGPPYIFRFTKIHELSGLLTRDCAIQFQQGSHFVVSDDNIVVHNGSAITSVVDATLRRWVFSQLNFRYIHNCFVIANPRLNECWFCFPEAGEQYCTKALVWNYKSNSSTITDLPSVVGGLYGSVPLDVTTWDSVAGTWDAAVTPWDSYVPNWVQMASNTDQNVTAMLDSNNPVGVPRRKMIERTGWAYSIGDKGPYPNFDTIKFCRSVHPRVQGSPGLQLSVYVGSHMYENGEITWHGPFEFCPDTQHKIDCAVSGRFLAFRFESNAVDWWRMTGFHVEVDDIGRY